MTISHVHIHYYKHIFNTICYFTCSVSNKCSKLLQYSTVAGVSLSPLSARFNRHLSRFISFLQASRWIVAVLYIYDVQLAGRYLPVAPCGGDLGCHLIHSSLGPLEFTIQVAP